MVLVRAADRHATQRDAGCTAQKDAIAGSTTVTTRRVLNCAATRIAADRGVRAVTVNCKRAGCAGEHNAVDRIWIGVVVARRDAAEGCGERAVVQTNGHAGRGRIA